MIEYIHGEGRGLLLAAALVRWLSRLLASRTRIKTAAAWWVAANTVFAQASAPDPVDQVRIREAYRLTASVQDSVWPGGWGEVPYPLLLVTSEREYLIAFPSIPSGFTDGRAFPPLGTTISERPRQLQPSFLATFPAFGPPSVIVVGRPEATGKTSTAWVLTLVHEHFHQFQTADPDYNEAVMGLDLSGGDETGMWMLNYPFPYETSWVVERFSALSRSLAEVLVHSSASDRRAFWKKYVAFLDELPERDRRYFSFQIWQEGVARYVELRTAEACGRSYEPTSEFSALPDFESYAAVGAHLRTEIDGELKNPDLAGRQRVSFYAFGAGLARLLDHDVPDWKKRYLVEKFAIERYIDAWMTNGDLATQHEGPAPAF